MLEIRALTKIFAANPGTGPAQQAALVVDNVSLSIRPGEFFSLLGPSGCGKTTLLRMIAGFEQPTRGEILHQGRRVDGLEPDERPFNLVFQKYALFPHLTVGGNLAFGPALKKLPRAGIAERIREMLALVRLEGFEDRRIQTLSGGQQQRVALARALINRPDILLLDEPLSALDLKLRQEMRVELLQIQRRLNHSFVFVTHDQEEALGLSDRIAVMNAGRIEQVGTPREIYDLPATPFVAKFVGSINAAEGTVRDGKIELSDRTPVRAHAQADSCGGSVEVMVRPERVRIGTGIKATNTLNGVLGETLFQGSTVDYIVQTAHGRWQASRPAGEESSSQLKPGNPVMLGWEAEDTLVFARN